MRQIPIAPQGPDTPWYLRYGVALAMVLAAVLLSVIAAPFISRAVFVLLWPALIATAWFIGFGPALFASLVGVLAIDYLLIPPRGVFDVDPIDLPQLGVFFLASTIIARLASQSRDAQLQLTAANTELAEANHTLQDQTVELEQTVEEAQTLNEELESANHQLADAHREAEDARGRLTFLAHASQVLASSLELDTTLRSVAELAIQRIGDWCSVELYDEQGERRRIVAHRDPTKVRWADEMDRRYPPDPDALTGVPAVLRTGKSELYPHITDEMLVQAARDPEHLQILREVGITAGIVAPIVSRDRVIGAISFVSAESGRSYTEDDLRLAEDLGRRAGAAVENARLLIRSERALQRARRLHAFAAALNVAATLEEVAEACVGHGLDALQADAASLALLVEHDTQFEILHSQGYPPAVAERWVRFPVMPGRPLSDTVLSREPRILATRAELGRYQPALLTAFADADTSAYIGIPLVFGGTALGGLSFSYRNEQVFDEETRALVLTLGEQAAQAIARARLLESERHAREAAEAANAAKSEFLSAMSHELRTPLNAIGGYVDLIDMGIRGPVSDAQRQDLARVRRAQEHLLGLVSDILNFARIEAGRIEYRSADFPIGALIRDLAGLLEPQAREAGLALHCEECDPDVMVRADPERVRQILINLIGNAIKFTQDGSVRVFAEVDPTTVRVGVADTGRGIPQDRLESIFDPFVQVDRNQFADSNQGIGLGLAISRELATGMSGSLSVTSTPGEGSTFVLTLPRAMPPEQGDLGMEDVGRAG